MAQQEHRLKLKALTAQLDAYTGLAGLLVMDTEKKELRLFDGSTVGGHRIMPRGTDDSYAKAVTTVTPNNGLTGGGDLSANRTIGLVLPATIVPGEASTFSAGPGLGHSHAISGVALSTYSIVGGGGLRGGGALSGNRALVMKPPAKLSATTINDPDTDLFEANMATLYPSWYDVAYGLNYGHTHEIDSTIARSAITMTAGNGFAAGSGGNLTASRTFTLGTPGNITDTSTSAVSANSHTHALDPLGLANIISKATATFPIGALVFGRPVSTTLVLAYGATLAGANVLHLADHAGTRGTLIATSATWRCLGNTAAGNGCLFIRIA